MKKLILIGAAILFVIAGCNKPSKAKQSTLANSISVTAIQLPTLKCNICVATVKKALASVEGIESAEINLDGKTATVKFLPATLERGKIEMAISKAGYDANNVRRDSTAYENLPECCK